MPRGGGVIGVRDGGLVGPGVVGGGELVHRGGGVIGAKWWWVGWSTGMVRWGPMNCCFAQKGMQLQWL